MGRRGDPRRVLRRRSPNVLHDFILPGAYGGLTKIDHAVLTAGGIMAGAISNSFIGSAAEHWLVVYIVEQSSRLLPFAVLIAAFTFIYTMIPNTRVKIDAALVGATVAGVVWGAAGWTFATFVVKSAQYVAIYSAFASLILLGGCAIAFYYQNRAYLSAQAGVSPLTLRQLDRMAVQALLLIHDAFEHAQTPWTEEALARRLHVPMEAMGEIARALCNAGLVTFAAGSPSRFVPTRPADRTRVADVLDAVRAQRYKRHVEDATLAHEPRVDAFFGALAAREAELADPTTIASLLAAEEPAAEADKAAAAGR